ncbi:DUF397 domain-containing protein [Streptosporangium nondiastaticum]|uniref:DUF397 domain-containing protein n=1 Tax=Streptosporangium nondiastaticum TaxID=35764 RepID=A0A9X7JM75_9ACTN|nr:DUF397 domain-containing protein [Streptosporangium nondiastaticum]PSJ26187.1 DUF397 domain-containing protein [Streptosporangium nondiastaticum]
MTRHSLPTHRWHKSSYSEAQNAGCIEMQATEDRLVAIGDSKARPRGAFVFSPAAWATFVHSIRKDTLQPVR